MVVPNQLYTQEVWGRLVAFMAFWMGALLDVDSYPDRERKFFIRTPRSKSEFGLWLDYGPYHATAFQLYNLGKRAFELAGVLTTWYASHLLDFYNGTGACCAGKTVGVQYATWFIITVTFVLLYKATDFLYAMGTTLPMYPPKDMPLMGAPNPTGPPAYASGSPGSGSPVESQYQPPPRRFSWARRVYLIMSAVTEFLCTLFALWIMAIYWSNFSGNGVMAFSAVLWTLYVLWQGFIWYLTYVYLYAYFRYAVMLDDGAEMRQLGADPSCKRQ